MDRVLGRPYVALSSVYDATVGVPFLRRARRAFLRLARRFGISPRCAADLGAGTGLFASWLARRYRIPVFAVERSRPMLAVGTARRADFIPVLQDIRALALPTRVDLMTANCDTINHLLTPDDVRRAFRAIARNLSPRGYFIFDLITSSQLPSCPRTVTFRQRRGWMTQRVLFEPLRRLLRVTVRIFSRRRARIVTERHTERVYRLTEVARWLTEARLTVRGVFDAATLDPVTTRLPARVVFVVQRRS